MAHAKVARGALLALLSDKIGEIETDFGVIELRVSKEVPLGTVYMVGDSDVGKIVNVAWEKPDSDGQREP